MGRLAAGGLRLLLLAAAGLLDAQLVDSAKPLTWCPKPSLANEVAVRSQSIDRGVSNMAKHRRRRAESFAIKRWLQLGAASAGLGAALLGLSLAGPDLGVALADTGDTPSVSAGPVRHEAAGVGSQRRSAKAARAEARSTRAEARSAQADDNDEDGAPTESTRQERVAAAIEKLSESVHARIDSRPVSDARKERLEDRWEATQRRFLNQAPTLAPVQVSGVIDGPVTGSLNAVDPDGDRMRYRVVKGPSSGSVTVARDGSYTYTPGDGFTGVDTFEVRAVDLGLHVNLLQWFRPAGTRASSLVNQGAIIFDFRYRDGADYWTEERRAALVESANALVSYFRVMAPVVIRYDITGVDDSSVGWLAGAGSNIISEDPGFWPTFVQNKLLTGEDANGDAADGFIEWNFSFAWALGDVVGDGEYDFMSTAMHELLHSFGFASWLSRPGGNDYTGRSVFARYLSTSDGTAIIGDDYAWPQWADANLVGGNGGLFFNGANAVAAYGEPVPLFAPDPWEPGSSGSHLDTFTFTGDNFQMMNHQSKGKGALDIRTLSPIEIGILRDLGYTVVPSSQSIAALSFVILLWRRRAKKA
ncbi:Ig-like domain-containing protein [Mycobacterium sp. C3-094]